MFDLVDMNQEVKNEYQRWIEVIGREDPYTSGVTIGIHEVMHAHFLLADYFFKTGEGMGGLGPKDLNLLHSALSRQFAEFGGKPRWSNGINVCALLMFGMIKNHPFHDANKRTAFLTSILHLQKIGRTPTATDIEYEDFTVAVANNNLDKYSFFDVSSKLLPDREIDAIAHFLRRNTRNIDLESKTITYNELNTILKKEG